MKYYRYDDVDKIGLSSRKLVLMNLLYKCPEVELLLKLVISKKLKYTKIVFI